MKKLWLALLLLQAPLPALAADKPNPADFPVQVHVSSSSVDARYENGLYHSYQVVAATIDGQPVQLTGESAGVLALGDYPARLSPKIHGPKNPNTYDVYRGYEFLLPDGLTRVYAVTGLGPAPPHR